MHTPTPVLLAQYDPDWPRAAASHSDQLRRLCPAIVAVHHIGSTAVPGLAAKPVTDLMPMVTSLAEVDHFQQAFESQGYQWHGEHGIAGRRFCTLDGENGTRLVHAHFFEPASPHVLRHIAFRDYLRAHPGIAQEYELEKRRARALHPDDSRAYTDEKAAWISAAEAQALRWFALDRATRLI